MDLLKVDGPPRPKKAPAHLPGQSPLVVLHNLYSDNLLHAHELGGLAAPSLAVAHQDNPFTDYGEITLVGHPDMVDPQKGGNLYSADVYSPRHPRGKYRINEQPFKKLAATLSPHFRTLNNHTDSSDLREKLNEGGIEGALGRTPIRHALAVQYLHETRRPPVVQMRDKPVHDLARTKAMRKFVAEHGAKQYGWESEDEGGPWHQAFSRALSDAIDEHVQGKIGQEMTNSKGSWTYDAEDAALHRAEHRKIHFDPETGLANHTGQRGFGGHGLFRGMAELDQREPDTRALENHVSGIADDAEKEEFERWAHAKLAPVLGERYIPVGSRLDSNGNRKDPGRERGKPYNLQEILGQMTRRTRSAEGGIADSSIGSARAMGTQKFKDLSQARAASHRLVSAEEFKRHKEELHNQYFKIMDSLESHWPGSGFGKLDAGVGAIKDHYRRRSMQSALEANGFRNVPHHKAAALAAFAQQLRNAPSEYFESKPQRVVGLKEFRGAVVPHDVRPDVLAALEAHGLPGERYTRGNSSNEEKAREDAERAAAVRRVVAREKLHLSEPVLAKHARPEHVAHLQGSVDQQGPELVDHEPHYEHHPSVQRHAEVYAGGAAAARRVAHHETGSGAKSVLRDLPGEPEGVGYMVKPYFAVAPTGHADGMPLPLGGWAEIASQALYHAGSIGYLHQAVHAAPHDFGSGTREPAVVIRMDPAHRPIESEWSDEAGGWSPKDATDQTRRDVRRIAVMDFLTGNTDRNPENLLMDPSGQPLAIDHQMAFQYRLPDRHASHAGGPADTFGRYHLAGLRAPQDVDPHEVETVAGKQAFRAAYQPAMQWWFGAAGKVRAEFQRHLRQVRDPAERQRIHRNFEARAGYLDRMADGGMRDLEWFNEPVAMSRSLPDSPKRPEYSREEIESLARELAPD